MVALGYVTHFDAAHFLPDYDGKCSRVHGHTWKVEVKICGEVENGNLIDFTLFKEIVDKVISALDHTLLNNTIVVPTAENISQFIWDGVNYELTEHIQKVTSHVIKNGGFKERSKSDVKLAMVKVWESEKCYAERVNSRIG